MFLSVHSLSMSLFCTFSCIVHPMNLQTFLATGMYLHTFICSSAISLSLCIFHVALPLVLSYKTAHFRQHFLNFVNYSTEALSFSLDVGCFDLLENGLNIVIFILHVAWAWRSYSQESGQDDQLVHFCRVESCNCEKSTENLCLMRLYSSSKLL